MSMLAFATLGCPGLPLGEVVDLAVRHGCPGVEFRYCDGEPLHPGLTDDEWADARQRLADAGVTPVALNTYVKVASGDDADDAAIVTDLRAHVRAASALGARYVRVFPGGPDASDPRQTNGLTPADERAARRLAAVADDAREAGVGVLLETHDSHRRASDAARVVSAAARRAGVDVAGGIPLGIVWDSLHTWRAGESAAEATGLLWPWLGYVQVKDVVSAEDTTPVAPGDGAFPLAEVLAELARRDYAGWVSLEYERAWHPQIPPLAQVLPAFTAALGAP